MNVINNYATIVTVLCFFGTSSCTAGVVNATIEGISSVVDSVKDIIPDCVFGVDTVSYLLFTRSIPDGIKVYMQDRSIPLRSNRRVVFFIHGFVSEVNGTQYVELIRTWLQKEDLNIFSVDWDRAACTGGLSITDYLAYNSAIKNVPVVANAAAKFIVKLGNFGVKIRETVIVGHSLGAHLAGFIGKRILQLAGLSLPLIVGLDPAGPGYNGNKCEDRLCISDAKYVLAFHTSYLKGYHQPIAVADYYFHGGTRQPKCSTFSTTCDHASAVTYLMESIRFPECYLGTRWQLDSSNILSTAQCNPSICTYARLNAPQQNAKGIYYVAPTATAPYCST